MQQALQNLPAEQKLKTYQKQQSPQQDDNDSMSEENPFQNLQLSSELVQPESHIHQEINQSEEKQNEHDFREIIKKSKKQKKKQKKMRKIKMAKAKKSSKKQNIDSNIQKSDRKAFRKMALGSSDQQPVHQQQKNTNLHTKQASKDKNNNKKKFEQQENGQQQDSEISEEYSSEKHLSSSESDGLANLNPNEEENQNSGRKFKKRLGKKSRKMRILEKEGFDLKQLGNDGDINYELNQSIDQSDDSFSEDGRKRKNKKGKKQKNDRNKKQKKQKLTNEQLMDKLKEMGCQEQIQENQSARYNYDSGIDQIQRMKSKKQTKNSIKVQNKLFGDLQMQLEKQIKQQQNNAQGQQQQIPQQKLELQFKVKSSINLSKSKSFLSKAEAIKKNRGLQADVDQEQFQKIAKQKAKRSISQLVSKIHNEIQDHEELDIQIKAPSIAKGKSGDLINNTMFIVRSMSHKMPSSINQVSLNNTSQIINPGGVEQSKQKIDIANNQSEIIVQKIASTIVSSFNMPSKNKRGVSRTQFFKQIKETINARRSKYVSAQQLKNSFKASKLQELQQIRKKIQEKRKKQAMYELGQMDDEDADNVIEELEQQLAKNQGMSKAQLRRQLRVQQGLQQLGQYEQEDQKKKKNKKEQENKTIQKDQENKTVMKDKQDNSNQVENNNSNSDKQRVFPINEKKEPLVFNTNPAIKFAGIIHNLNKQNKQRQVNQDIEEEMGHKDDAIDEYQIEQNIQNQEMDVEELNQEDQQQILDEEEQQNDEGQHSQDNDDQEDENQMDGSNQEENQQQQQSSNNLAQTQKKQNLPDDQQQILRKQLEDQGIMMPGANRKKFNHFSQNQNININQYIIQNQNQDQKHSQIISNPLAQTDKNSNNVKLAQANLAEFKQFKKLRKIAVVIQQKKKKRQQQLKRAKQYFQQQAELGSDNQDNDDHIKNINKKDEDGQYDGDDLDQQLQELIDNAVDINEANEEQAFKKYMEDVKQKDRQQLQRILRGDFRRPNHDQLPQMAQMEEDERNRIERMQKMVQWMNKRQQDEGEMYMKDQQEQDDEMNYYYDYKGNRIRISDKKNKNNEQEAQEIPQEDQQVVERKLQYYLMDTISPAKKDTDIQISTQLVMELPTMLKKNNRSLIGAFGKKNSDNNESEQCKMAGNNRSNPFSFGGSILNLGSNKNDNNNLNIVKGKKTSSHMSQYLNKNKSQKPMPFQPSSAKLPAIFGRVFSSKK